MIKKFVLIIAEVERCLEEVDDEDDEDDDEDDEDYDEMRFNSCLVG